MCAHAPNSAVDMACAPRRVYAIASRGGFKKTALNTNVINPVFMESVTGQMGTASVIQGISVRIAVRSCALGRVSIVMIRNANVVKRE